MLLRILIQSPGEKRIRLIFPTRLLFNFMTASLVARIVGKYIPMEEAISSKDIRRMVRVIRRMKRKHPKMKLVHVESSDGEIVQISL